MKVLFVCTANSCRSQMAEAWARHLFPEGWQAASAGLVTYRITDRTRWVMEEAGVSMEGQCPKTFDRFDLDEFDLVVTLSEEAGRFLPELAHPERHLRRPMDDPMASDGDPEERREDFRTGRDLVRSVVQDLVDGRLGPGG
ncbi:MAG: arsenate reductase ArsC [bacterium]|nr:arsenate reductase ArsC [bacterium]